MYEPVNIFSGIILNNMLQDVLYGFAMAMSEDLDNVRSELADISAQIEALLDRQQFLLSKKLQLEATLSAGKKSSTANSKEDEANWSATNFPWSEKLEETCEKVFKITNFRPLQLECINVTMSGRDCILIMPTGGGKSLCFQLPGVISNGVTLVVSPLVSLMEDQLIALKELDVKSSTLNASSSKQEVNSVHSAMVEQKSDLKLLYVTPEKISKSKRFMAKLEKTFQVGRLSRIVIDEVHCASQWGHDFRPDYKILGILKRQFPGVPVLCLTATATSKVVDDVKKILGLQKNCVLFKASFNRPNLFYEVRSKPSSQGACMDDIYHLITTRCPGQSGIVYCFSRKETEQVAEQLVSRGIFAAPYHADLTAESRSQVHKLWIQNKVQVVVATVAFGMGIDKADVRFVVHHSLSKSMENFYQESGRAGRDDVTAHCIVYYRPFDAFRQSTMVFTEQTGLENFYGMLAYCQETRMCRRSLIARHFGEAWDPENCAAMCDHCRRNGAESNGGEDTATQKKDISHYCLDVLKIIQQGASLSKRITALKLLEAWYGRGQTSLRVRDVKRPDVAKEDGERMIIHLLLEGVLREDFHFTPYSTISYLVAGPKAKAVSSGMRVFMDLSSSGVKSGKDPKNAGSKRKSSALRPSETTTRQSNDEAPTPNSSGPKRNPIGIHSEMADVDFVANPIRKVTSKERKRIDDEIVILD